MEPIIENVREYALSQQGRPKADFSKVGIVGCGSTGQRLAIIMASRGMDVVFIELSEEKIQEAYEGIKEELSEKLHHWGITEGEMRGVISRIHGSTDYKELEGCDLVMESILSRSRETAKEARKEIFQIIEQNVSRNCIIATNSTTIAITELSSGLKYKDRCVSMHISLTSPEARLVEVVKSIYTTEEVCENVQKFAVLIGRDFIRVAESPGLITVRLFAPMINEACDILLERVASLENIDFAAKKSMNLPLGPFEMADKIGIDRIVRWLENMYEEFGDHEYKASPILRRLARAGQIGRKTGKGFYVYDEKGNKKIGVNKFI